MAALELIANSGSQLLVTNMPETIFQSVVAENHRTKVKSFSITIGGIIGIECACTSVASIVCEFGFEE